jgi:hypothetical protein
MESSMDLVKSILDQFTGDNLSRLSSELGATPKATQSAVAAAVPTILSSLAGLASTHDGAKKLSNTLGGFDFGKLGSLANMLTGNTNSVTQQGGSLLANLFGDTVVSNIGSYIGRFAGLDERLTKTLLSFVTPLILGKVAGAWQNKGGTVSALQGLLSDQQENIADALPTGFSLANIPGLPSADAAMRAVGRTANAAAGTARDVSRHAADTAQDATKTLLSWLLPLAALLLAAAALWYFFGRGPAPDVAQRAQEGANAANRAVNRAADATAAATRDAADATAAAANRVAALRPTLPELSVPELSAVTKDLTGIFNSATQSLNGIRDASSANAALPQLTKIGTQIDAIRAFFDRLPAASQAALGEQIGKQFGPLQEQAAKILAMPGASPEVKASLAAITNKLAGLNLAQVSQDTSDIFASLTKTLSGFNNAAAAEAAVPQLEEVAGKIDNLKQVRDQMTPGGQSMLAKLVAAARGPLDQLIAKVLTALGADAAAVKPVLDVIANKIAGLTA